MSRHGRRVSARISVWSERPLGIFRRSILARAPIRRPKFTPRHPAESEGNVPNGSHRCQCEEIDVYHRMLTGARRARVGVTRVGVLALGSGPRILHLESEIEGVTPLTPHSRHSRDPEIEGVTPLT